MNKSQLLEIAHAAIDQAESPEHLQQLMEEAGIDANYHHHDNKEDGFIDGWTLKTPGSKTWVRGSEVESDRFETLGWLRIAKAKGWPMSWRELADEKNAQRAPGDRPAPQSPAAAADGPQLTERPEAPEARQETDEEELQRLIDNLMALMQNMIAAVQHIVAGLTNALLRACHVEHQIELLEYAEQKGAPGAAPAPAETAVKADQTDQAKEGTKAAAKAIKQMVEALQQNKPGLLPKAPAGDAEAAANRKKLALVLTDNRLAQLNEGRGENPYADDDDEFEEEEPEVVWDRMTG